MSAFMPDDYIQIDAKSIKDGYVRCNMYTGNRCIQVVILESDYNDLVRDGFFVRNGKSVDSAGVINTTNTYIPQ